MGRVLDEIGSRDEAKQAFEQARELAEQTARTAPANREKARDLAEATWLVAAQEGMSGKISEGSAKLHQARVSLESLLEGDPTDQATAQLLAKVLHDLGELENVAGRPEQAIGWLRLAYERSPGDSLNEARCRLGIARAFSYMARNAEALAEAEAARDRLTKMAHDAARQSIADFERARIETMIGQLHVRLRNLPAAAAAHAQARAMLEPMARDNPAAMDIQHEYAATFGNVGMVALAQNKPDEARLAFRDAARRYDALRLAGTAGGAVIEAWVICQLHLGAAEIAVGDSAAARESWRRVTAEEQEIRQAFPDNLDLANEIVRVWFALGMRELADGNPTEALAACDRGIAVARDLCRRSPRGPFHAQNLGAALHRRGAALLALGKLPEAEAAFSESIKVTDDLLSWNEKHPAAPGNLVSALAGRAEVYTRTDRHAEALADFERLLPLAKGPEQDEAALLRAAALARLGRYHEAADEAERIAPSIGGNAMRLYDVARVVALCAASTDKAASDAAAGRAIDLIRQAAEAGYSDLENIKTDPDLNALRELPEFKQLIAALENARSENGRKKD
jgi:tetratricopeptide (TPR) repeat protein